jgi:hypothetical protein
VGGAGEREGEETCAGDRAPIEARRWEVRDREGERRPARWRLREESAEANHLCLVWEPQNRRGLEGLKSPLY